MAKKLLCLIAFIIANYLYAETEDVARITSVNFILETSGSMRGYFYGGEGINNFKQKIISTLVKLNNIKNEENGSGLIKIDNVRTLLIDNKYNFVDFGEDIKKFINDINYNATALFIGGDTKLDLITERVLQITDDNSVSILVSDCILSTKQNLQGNLQAIAGNIPLVFSNYKNYGVVFYKYYSLYSGWYYPWRGKSFEVANVQRPFYFVIFGKTDMLEKFLDFLKDELKSKAVDWKTIGFPEKIKAEIVRANEDKGFKRIEDDKILLKKGKAKFFVAVDLNFLSSYRMAKIYDLMRITTNNNQAIGYAIYPMRDFKENLNKQAYPASEIERLAKKYTHVIEIDCAVDDKLTNISLSLALDGEDWHYDGIGSTYDDTSIDKITDSTTFGFYDFVAAFEKGIEGKKTAVAEIKISPAGFTREVYDLGLGWLIASLVAAFLCAFAYYFVLVNAYEFISKKVYWSLYLLWSGFGAVLYLIFRDYYDMLVMIFSVLFFLAIVFIFSLILKKFSEDAPKIPF